MITTKNNISYFGLNCNRKFTLLCNFSSNLKNGNIFHNVLSTPSWYRMYYVVTGERARMGVTYPTWIHLWSKYLRFGAEFYQIVSSFFIPINRNVLDLLLLVDIHLL